MKRGFGTKPAEAPTAEFGRYLAQACTGCHGAELRGGPIPGGDPSWPHATPLRMAAASGWTEAAFRDAIRTGIARSTGQPMRAPMPVVALQQMDETEISALWKFFSSLE